MKKFLSMVVIAGVALAGSVGCSGNATTSKAGDTGKTSGSSVSTNATTGATGTSTAASTGSSTGTTK